MENYFNLFEKFGNSQKKYTCSVGKDEFLIHVFSKEEIELLKELVKLILWQRNILFLSSGSQGIEMTAILKITLKKFLFSSVK